MARPSHNWGDPVGTWQRLHDAMLILVRAEGKYQARAQRATSILTHIERTLLPPAMLERFDRIMAVRVSVAAHYPNEDHFAFDRLSPKRRLALAQDLLELYEGCLLDLGRRNDEMTSIAYPGEISRSVEDEPPP